MVVTRDRVISLFRPGLGPASILFVVASRVDAETLWTGPNVTWTRSATTPTDTVLAAKVVLKRNGSGPLYNTALGELSARQGSPKGIEYAFGELSNFEGLTYQSLDSLRKGNLAARILNKPMVTHILDGDIYFSIVFKTWGTHGAGTVSYSRSTQPAASPPVLNLTSPADGATFTAPATITLRADATGGIITGVSFFNGTALLGTVQSAPYNFTLNNLEAGSYAFTAVGSTAQASATSGIVHVTVTAPLTDITLAAPLLTNGFFSFSYSTDPEHSYVIQSASGLNGAGVFDWTPLVTNTASRSFESFSQALSSADLKGFRVGRIQ